MSSTMPVGARDLLRHGPFLFFLLSRSLSRFASQIAAVAIGWQIYDITGSAFQLGMVGLVQFLPTALLVFVAGHAADRFERKRVVQLCQLAEAATALFLAVSTFSGWLTEVQIFIATFVIGIAGAFESPATAALLPLIAPKGSVQRATAISSGAAQVATITGPALGGLAYVFAPSLPYFVIVVFWLVGAVLTGLIHIPKQEPSKQDATADDVFAGVRFIRSNPAILGTISLDMFAVLLGGVTALLPIYARDILETGPLGLGILRAAPAVGALLMTMVLARHSINRHVGLRMFQAVIVFGAATVVFALSQWMWLSVAGAGGAGRRRHDQRGDTLFAGTALDARRDARPGRRGQFPVHQCLQPARPVRKRRHRGAVRRDAGRRARRRRDDRDRAAMDEAVSGAAEGGAAGVGGYDVSARRPCERRDPYRVISRVNTNARRLVPNQRRGVWVPAFAGTTAVV